MSVVGLVVEHITGESQMINTTEYLNTLNRHGWAFENAYKIVLANCYNIEQQERPELSETEIRSIYLDALAESLEISESRNKEKELSFNDWFKVGDGWVRGQRNNSGIVAMSVDDLTNTLSLEDAYTLMLDTQPDRPSSKLQELFSEH